MIVLKHLARDINWDPHKLRKTLRAIYGKVKGHRWRWESLTDPKYLKIKASVLSHNNTSRLPPAHTRGKQKPSSMSRRLLQAATQSPSMSSSVVVSTKRKSS